MFQSAREASTQVTCSLVGGVSYRARTRCILAMKSESVDAFLVVLVCQETLPSRRLRRRVSRLIVATM
jgi:hypothetical protein